MKRAGYTIMELMVASTISVLVIGGVVGSMAHVLRSWREAEVNSELNINLELAMERMRQDMRLSSVGVGLMSFYPAGEQRYTAISFPMASDQDEDGLLDRDAEGKILWTDTVIYHILQTSPNELRRTLFYPRNTNATPDALYAQLKQVTEAGSESAIANAALDDEGVNSRTIFRNLTRLYFYPPESMFDGYSAKRKRSSTYNFGSVVLDAGYHELTFTVKGKNQKSSGFDIQIDRFRLSLSGSPREGEIFIPQNTHPRSPLFSYADYAGTTVAEDMSAYGAQWSGNGQAVFKANGKGSAITFHVYDDLWCDSNFDEPGGQISSNCSVKWDTSFASIAPYIGDRVVSMDKGIAWTASGCGDTSYTLAVTNPITVDSIIYGSAAQDDMAISMNGCWTRLFFERPEGYALHLDNVRITDAGSGASEPVTFNKGNASLVVGTNGPSVIASDWVELWEIDQQNSYTVSYSSAPQDGGKWGLAGWLNTDGIDLSLVNGAAVHFTAGIHALEVGYAKEAIYRSGIYDTQAESPKYLALYWTHVENFGAGGDIDIRVRSGDNPDMSDGYWTDAYAFYDGYFQSNSGNSLKNLSRRRYIQYEAAFRCGFGGNSAAHTNEPTAVLRDVSILWGPPLGLVDLEVDFGMGPDCGIVEATVDGQKFVKSMTAELEIYKSGPRGVQTVRGEMEIKPLNTGK